MASIKRRKNAWRARVRRANFPVKTATFDTKQQAEQWARRIEAEMDAGAIPQVSDANHVTLRAALERYAKTVTPHKKGAKQERVRINYWCNQPISNKTLTDITTAELSKWRDDRRATGLAVSTIRNDLMVLRDLYEVARLDWYYESLKNPVAGLRWCKAWGSEAMQKRERRLNAGEEETLLAAARQRRKYSKHLAAFIVLALETGMRRGEIFRLDWAHVDLEKRLVRLKKTKNGDARTVPLSRRAASTLAGLSRDKKGPLWPWRTPDTVTHGFREICRDNGIENLCLHDLRHEATSRLFERGGLNVMEVSMITGHKTLQMLQRYTHPDPEKVRDKLDARVQS